MVSQTPASDPRPDAPAAASDRSAQVVAHNLRRLMAQAGMTYDEVVEASGLDARTIRGVARAKQSPQARTLHRLAAGFGVAVDELFAPPAGLSPSEFDAATNPAVHQIRESHPELFAGWSAEEFAELTSRFGIGGELSEAGAVAEANKMNARRDVLRRAKVVMETAHAGLLTELVDLLYERVRLES